MSCPNLMTLVASVATDQFVHLLVRWERQASNDLKTYCYENESLLQFSSLQQTSEFMHVLRIFIRCVLLSFIESVRKRRDS